MVSTKDCLHLLSQRTLIVSKQHRNTLKHIYCLPKFNYLSDKSDVVQDSWSCKRKERDYISSFNLDDLQFPRHLKTTFPKLLEEHWKSIIETMTNKCLQDIHDLFKDKKESWKTEADQKRADFRSLGDSILSHLATRGEIVLGDIKKLIGVSQEVIADSIKDGMKRIEKQIVKGEETIEKKTEKGKRSIDQRTVSGGQKIEQYTEIGEQMIKKRTKIGERNIEVKTEIGKQKIVEKTEIGKQMIDAKIREFDEKSGKLTKADLRKELIKLYNTNASTVRIRLDIDEAVENIYEEPKLTLKARGDDLSGVNEIFRGKGGTMAKTIFVEGEPGSGKSSLCKKIVHDWCKTKGEGRTIYSRTGNKWDVKSRQFEFVFYITLREAKKECNIKKMILKTILERIGIDKISGESLLGKLLKSNICLVLLDGLDEWKHPEECQLDERIPHVETSWENCTILITTRPYKLAELKLSSSQIGKHVVVEGVSNPERLVEKIVSSLNGLPCLGPSQDPGGTRLPLNHEVCIEKIHEKDLWHFSICPFVLAHIVWLWYKGKLSADTKISDLYETLLKERWFESCDKRNSSSGFKYKDVINTLSEIAFAKLFAEDENNTILFEIDNEENSIFKSKKTASLESGIISCTNIPGDSAQYHFLHKSFQEYLAALCISKDTAKSCLHIKQTYRKHRRESGVSLSQILIFLCNMNTKAAQELSNEMNELFTDFCNVYGYCNKESKMLQKKIIQGQIELDRSDNPRGKLCLQHITMGGMFTDNLTENEATILEQYVKTNQSRLVSLNIEYGSSLAFHLANSIDNEVLDLKNYNGLQYLNVEKTSYKDVIGLNLSNLVECSITFKTLQQAPNLTSEFYNSDIDCLQKLKTLDLSGLKDYHWLHKVSERKGIKKVLNLKLLKWLHKGSKQKEFLDLRHIGNLEHLKEVGLNRLSYSDVVNIPVFRLQTLKVGFIELQQAPQLMSTLLTQGTCQNEREGLFSHLKNVYLELIRISEEHLRRLLQSFIKSEGTSFEFFDCSIGPEDDFIQPQNEFEQQVASSNSTTNIQLKFGSITIEGFICLIDYVTRCGQSVTCVLDLITLESNHAIELPAFPMVVLQPMSADYTTVLELTFIKISTERICQLISRVNQLSHSVTLRLQLHEIPHECNPLKNQLVPPPPNPSYDCTKLVEIKNMELSETVFWYAATSAIYFGNMFEMSECDILANEVPHADNSHFPKMAAINPPAQTAILRFHIASLPQDVVKRLVCQAAVSGQLVECVLDKCYIWPPSACLSLKEKMEGDPAIQIEKFKFEANNDERYCCPKSNKADRTYDICFRANAMKTAFTESTDV